MEITKSSQLPLQELLKSQHWHKQQAFDSCCFTSNMNWKPGNRKQGESDLLATDDQLFLLPKPET